MDGRPRVRKEVVPDPPDEEWDEFLTKVQSSNGCDFLISVFARKSKSHGECLAFLRNLINRTFKNLKNDPELHLKCSEAILQMMFQLTLQSWSIPESTLGDLMSLGLTEIKHFSSAALSSVVENYCLVYMKNNPNSELPARWIDVFGKVATALNTRGDIEHEGDVVDGKAFRNFIVAECCRMDWSTKIVLSMVSVLQEMPGIDVLDVDNILNKLKISLKTMNTKTIPSMINQVITLTGNFRPALLLQICDDYFKSILTKPSNLTQGGERCKKNVQPEDSIKESRQALAKIAFHFVDSARDCQAIVREVQKLVKASVYDHTLVMSPFILAVVLGMSSIDYLRASIVEPLKTAIIKSFHEANLCQESKWYKLTKGNTVEKIKKSFQALLLPRSSDFEYMAEGLKDLGISLLNAENMQWKYPNTTKKCKALGSYLLISVIFLNKEYLATLMKELLKSKSMAHIETLAECLNQCTRTVSQRVFHGRMYEILQHLPATNVETAAIITKSLMPAFQLSPALFDELMIVLRKTFWKSVTAGQICVEIMCVILSNSVTLGNVPMNEMMRNEQGDDLLLSQCTQGVSQGRKGPEVDLTPLCIEILDLAKRFLLLHCKVREQLYLGLHRVCRKNPLLVEIICGQLLSHSLQYMADVKNKESITFSPLFEFSDSNANSVVLKDELGFLVQCIGFVVHKAYAVKDYLTSDPTSYRLCLDILRTWIEYVCGIDTDTLEIVSTNIVTLSGGNKPVEVARYIREVLVVQVMQIIEALMEFLCLVDWWDNGNKSLKRLFSKYQELEKYSKEKITGKKGKATDKAKGTKKAKSNDSKSKKAMDTSSLISGSQNTQPPSKIKKLDIPKKVVLYHLMNLDSVCQALREMYRPDSDGKRFGLLQTNNDFEKLMLNTLKQKIEKLKAKQPMRERHRNPGDINNCLSCLTVILWKKLIQMERIWKSEGEILTDTTEIVELRLQVLCDIMIFFYRERENERLKNFRNYGCVNSAAAGEDIFEEWKKIFCMVETEYDGGSGKGNPLLLNILDEVCKVLSDEGILMRIHAWVWGYLKQDDPNEEGKVGTFGLLDKAILLYVTCHKKCSEFPMGESKDVLRLAKAVRVVCGDVDGESFENRNASWLITVETAPNLLLHVAAYVDDQLKMVNIILGRLKSHRQYLSAERSEEMRENCIKMLEDLRLVSTELVRTAFPAGTCCAAMLKLVPQIYSTMSSFTEYLLDLTKNKINYEVTSFKNLVGALGKEFKIRVETMIQHVEYVHRHKFDTMGKNKKGKISASLKHQLTKDTKLIPNLVYHAERFDQQIIALSTKSKVNMLVGMKLSTARDFRIETSLIKTLLTEKEQNETLPAKKGRNKANTSAANSTISGSTNRSETSSSAPAKRGRKRK